MAFLDRFLRSSRKRRAIRSYARQLPRLLARDYGFSRCYAAQQVRRTIERSGLDADFSCYGIAMFSDRDDFNQFHHDVGENCDYDAMRAEVANSYFHGNADFSVSDLFALSSGDGADMGHGGSHDAGGGDGHGGHGN